MARRNGQMQPIAAHHASHLLQSGIPYGVAVRAGIYSDPSPAKHEELLGRTPGFYGNAIVFRYLTPSGHRNGYCRVKPDNPRKDENGRPVKYEAPSGQPPHAYFPPGITPALENGRKPLLITEGEKKSLAAMLAGLPCIGIPGNWNWQQRRKRDKNGRAYGRRELIHDLAGVSWKGRPAYICFDNDGVDGNGGMKPEVLHAEFELAKALEREGATVKAIRLPSGPNGKKMGLDDYLLAHSPRQLKRLMRTATVPEKPQGRRRDRGKPPTSGRQPRSGIPASEEEKAPAKPVKKISLKKCRAVFQKWLHLPDADIVDVVLGAVAGNRLEGDPLWLLLVGPPGDGKTELLRSLFDHEEIFSLSSLTPQTLISGLKPEPGEGDPSLLPDLDGKVLTIKDFLLSQLNRNPMENWSW